MINTKQINAHWEEILRLAASIQQGTVTASLMPRKLGAYPARTRSPWPCGSSVSSNAHYSCSNTSEMSNCAGRIHIGLNKGEARNALAGAVFFNRLGELRDRTLENQQHRTSGLNLGLAAIVLWNTVYLERAIQALRNQGQIDRRLPLASRRRPAKSEVATTPDRLSPPATLP